MVGVGLYTSMPCWKGRAMRWFCTLWLKEGGNSSSCRCFVLDLIFFLVVAAELIYWLLPGSEELTLHP